MPELASNMEPINKPSKKNPAASRQLIKVPKIFPNMDEMRQLNSEDRHQAQAITVGVELKNAEGARVDSSTRSAENGIINERKKLNEDRKQLAWEQNPGYTRMSSDDRLLRSCDIWRKIHKYADRATKLEQEVLNVQFFNEYGAFLKSTLASVIKNPDDMHLLDNPKRFLADWTKRINENDAVPANGTVAPGRYSFSPPPSPTSLPEKHVMLQDNMHQQADMMAFKRAITWRRDPEARRFPKLEKLREQHEKRQREAEAKRNGRSLQMEQERKAWESARSSAVLQSKATETTDKSTLPAWLISEIEKNKAGKMVPPTEAEKERDFLKARESKREDQFQALLSQMSKDLASNRQLLEKAERTNAIWQRYTKDIADLEKQRDADLGKANEETKPKPGRSCSVPRSTSDRMDHERYEEAIAHAEWHTHLKKQILDSARVPMDDVNLVKYSKHREKLKRGRGEDEPLFPVAHKKIRIDKTPGQVQPAKSSEKVKEQVQPASSSEEVQQQVARDKAVSQTTTDGKLDESKSRSLKRSFLDAFGSDLEDLESKENSAKKRKLNPPKTQSKTSGSHSSRSRDSKTSKQPLPSAKSLSKVQSERLASPVSVADSSVNKTNFQSEKVEAQTELSDAPKPETPPARYPNLMAAQQAGGLMQVRQSTENPTSPDHLIKVGLKASSTSQLLDGAVSNLSEKDHVARDSGHGKNDDHEVSSQSDCMHQEKGQQSIPQPVEHESPADEADADDSKETTDEVKSGDADSVKTSEQL